MNKNINSMLKEAKEAFNKASTEKELYDLKVQYLGKKSFLILAMRGIKDLPLKERPAHGQQLNKMRLQLDSLYLKRKREIVEEAIKEDLKKEAIDLSLPGPYLPIGAKHPISQVIELVVDVFKPLGYSVQTGPFVESDWYNFSALNFPPFHPSRDLQDSFYIGEDHVLRTHTSPVQIRILESQKPPLSALAPGAVFRRDSDVSHSPMFHQVEGLYVNRRVSLADLKGTLSYFLKELFQESKAQVRFRPSFFPFTEPSAEYDVSCLFCSMKGCSVCKKTGWIEIGGCGLVHPKVFHSVNMDSSQWQGFAFGLGVERLALLLYGIPNIRLFFENDIRFLKQFSSL